MYKKNSINILFSNELKIFHNDFKIYKVFFDNITTKNIQKFRTKSIYRKKGYGGHPIYHTFKYPLENKILLYPAIYNLNINLIIFIHSRPDEFFDRLLSRKSNNKIDYVYIIYITSRSSNNDVNEKLRYESYIYHDILQFSEISSYFNLSIQTVHMILWSRKIKFKYLVKTDVDVYINIPFIINWLNNNDINYDYYAIGKKSITHVLRNKKYSHYVPRDIIKESVYPPYLQGVGYIIPFNTVKLLSESVDFVNPKIWIEDVFMGYMFKYNNISLIDISSYILRDIPNNFSEAIFNANNYMFIHGLYPIEIYLIKNRYAINKYKC